MTHTKTIQNHWNRKSGNITNNYSQQRMIGCHGERFQFIWNGMQQQPLIPSRLQESGLHLEGLEHGMRSACRGLKPSALAYSQWKKFGPATRDIWVYDFLVVHGWLLLTFFNWNVHPGRHDHRPIARHWPIGSIIFCETKQTWKVEMEPANRLIEKAHHFLKPFLAARFCLGIFVGPIPCSCPVKFCQKAEAEFAKATISDQQQRWLQLKTGYFVKEFSNFLCGWQVFSFIFCMSPSEMLCLQHTPQIRMAHID